MLHVRKIRPWRPIAIAALAVLGACAPSSRPEPPPPGPGAPVRLPATVTPIAYRLRITPDPGAMRFAGAESISLRVNRPTGVIVLNANELNFDRVRLDGRAARSIRLDANAQTAAFVFDREVAPGLHTLDIDYRGRINEGAQGLFALDYDTAQGQRRMLATQFEAVDARRFLPCWDEPGVKATFALTAVAPLDQLVVSNMPVAASRPLPGGLKAVSFQPTPKMSSYLLFLGMGELERVSRMVDGVDVGVVVRKGAGDQARYALDRAAELLAYYDRYFGLRYPLPKLDLIGAPGAAGFGAMENWGAILYFEPRLLVDPRRTAQSDREGVAVTVAHEMAHQWFGDLVTMAWWDDVWLNESFADWMEVRSLTDLHPDWRVGLTAMAGRESAMRLDGGGATHPVVEPAETLDQVNELPDAIVYNKGAAVLTMLEAYVGRDAWREGVRAYIRRFAYANARRADLWAAIEHAARRPVAGIAHDFTEQDGLPLVRAQAAAGGLQLSEDRFRADAASKGERRWRIPAAVASPGGGPGAPLLLSAGASAPARGAGQPLVVNPGQVGYFRTLYADAAFQPILDGLARLEPSDQLGLVNDGWALAQAGYAPADRFMRLVERLPDGAEPRVWAQTLTVLSEIDRLDQGLPGQPRFRAWARRRLQPLMARVGWDAGPDDRMGILRERLLSVLGDLGDEAAIAGARARFAASGAALAPDIRGAVLGIVGANADAATFEKLRTMAAGTADPADKRLFLTAMAGARDPALARRALELSLSPQTPTTLGPVLIATVAVLHPDLAWDFAIAHRAQLDPRLDPSQRLNFIPRLLRQTSDAAHADRLHAFSQKAYAAGGRREADKVEAAIRQRAEVRRRALPGIDRWLVEGGSVREPPPAVDGAS